MIISFNKEKLVEPLKNIVGVSEKKQTMPILGNVLLRSLGGGRTLVVASDLEVEISADIQLEDDVELNHTIPAKKLLDILKSLPGSGDVSMDFSDSKVTVRSGKSRFTLATLDGQDFPYSEIQESTTTPIEINTLEEIINQTSFSMAVQDARHFLNGLFVEMSPDKITAVATDGHRLALCTSAITKGPSESINCIIPRKCITELRKILAGVDRSKMKIAEVSVSNKEILLKIDNFLVKSKLIEGNYPDYNKVFPESLPHKLNTDKNEFKAGLQRMAILSNDQFKGVKLSLDSTSLKLTTNNPSQEEGEDSISCQYDGDNFDVGFNLTYLLEVIDAVKSDNLEIQLNNSDSGCLITSNNSGTSSKYIIMPMRV